MSLSNSLPVGLKHPVRFLSEELTPYPGRLNILWRVLLSSTVIIMTSLALEVPFLMLSLLVVLAVTQSNLLLSRLIGVVVIIALTMTVGIMILVYKYTIDYPLLRIIISCALLYGSVYMMRAATLGPVFFVLALITFYGQTFVDDLANGEVLVRAMLWLWVSMCYPVIVGLIINTILLPVEPRDEFKKEFKRQLQVIDTRLANLLNATVPQAPIQISDIQKGALTLQKQLKFASMRDKSIKEEQARYLATIATVSRLYYAAADLPAESVGAETELAEPVQFLRNTIMELDEAIANERSFLMPLLPDFSSKLLQNHTGEALVEMLDALKGLSDFNQHPSSHETKKETLPMLVPDAFTNPVYNQFALKTLLAVMLTYTFYNASDWNGIHTCMLTCIIVAQSSFGAVMRKSWLRIFGAAIGSLLALFAIVFVIPQIDDLVGVLMMTLPVMAFSSWLMAGSERISYMGMQILVTFGLALLMDFSPTMNLMEVRDRITGVVIGLVVYTAISALIWPESEGKTARNSLAELLKEIGKFLKPLHKQLESAAPTAIAQQHLSVMNKIGNCEEILARVALEPNGRESEHEELTLTLQTLLAQARSLVVATNDLQRLILVHQNDLSPKVHMAIESVQEQVISALDVYSDGLEGTGCQSPPLISLDPLTKSFSSDAADMPERLNSTILNAMQNVVVQLTKLPSWGETAPIPINTELATSDV